MHRCFHMRSAVHRLASRTPSSNPTNPTNSAVLRSLHTSSIHSIDASSAPSIPLVHTSASLAAAAAGTKLLNYTRTSPRRRPNSKKLPKARMPKIMAPLLTRVWKSGQQSGVRGTISPDDWVNVVKTNRRRLLQLKEKEQFHAWSNFQAMKKHRLDWLKEQGEEPSKEMLERIEQREASIMKISEAARAQLDAPIPPQKTVNKRSIKNNKGIASAARALSHPQTYLQTAFPNEAWRVFSFRLTHYHSHILHKQMEKFREMAKKMGLSPSFPTYLPHRTKRFTIIRSPHVDKTSREQYETRLYSLKIHISTSPEKFYAIKRLSQLTFRLINGPVRMRIETPPNVAIETLNFAPDPLKTDLGNVPPQLYASRDSPGIENILYKLDQHQFPFLKDWQEEILDDKFRGIYPADRDTSGPMHMRADEMDELGAAQAELESATSSDADVDADGGSQFIFDENGEFQLEDDLVGEDESIDIDLGEDELSEPEAFDQEAEKLTNPIVRRKRRY